MEILKFRVRVFATLHHFIVRLQKHHNFGRCNICLGMPFHFKGIEKGFTNPFLSAPSHYLHPFIKEKKRKKRTSKLRNFLILGTLVNTWVPHISYRFKYLLFLWGWEIPGSGWLTGSNQCFFFSLKTFAIFNWFFGLICWKTRHIFHIKNLKHKKPLDYPTSLPPPHPPK